MIQTLYKNVNPTKSQMFIKKKFSHFFFYSPHTKINVKPINNDGVGNQNQ